MLSVLPIPIVIEDITTTGSAIIDWMGMLSIALYDLVTGAGSSVADFSSVQSSELNPF
ncbi:hypothetical protein [Corynebacterium alimapuense]|uniref:hypothetical protein n=1 Tax=Corynebacterium alimapuense TaxID=1576874 RepID=UPI001401FF9B|nr:hypothetical protein [Corynebacterium alimapuense]